MIPLLVTLALGQSPVTQDNFAWTKVDTALTLALTFESIYDLTNTRYCLERVEGCEENDPFLGGKHPDLLRLYGTAVFWGLMFSITARAMPHPWREIFMGAVLSLETANLAANTIDHPHLALRFAF